MNLLERSKELIAKLDVKEEIKEQAVVNLKEWLNDDRLAGYGPYIEDLVENKNGGALLDSFWRMIPFGTGGRRGPVGAGPNRINPHTVSLSVQGHCQYLREVVGGEAESRVVVAYDVREFLNLRGTYSQAKGLLNGLTSRDMAKFAAMTYAANGVVAYIVGPLEDEKDAPLCTDRYISTPELSFLIRELGAAGGLNISASHNHPDDNGGKFYNVDGGQEIPPHDEALLKIVETVNDVKSMDYAQARATDMIRLVPPSLHEEYIRVNMAYCPTDSRSVKVAFTPLCGVGMTTVKEALEALGFPVVLVPKQCEYDGSFESVRYRIGNPEVPESMDRLVEVAKEHGCGLGFATDPDADRLGMVVPDGAGEFTAINGNEIGIILLESLMQAHVRGGTMPSKPMFFNTMVTSGLQREIARRYKCQVIGDLMVGFKYMGDVLRQIQQHGRFPVEENTGKDEVVGTLEDFVFTCEESHGYLVTPRVRDKDACGAAVHLAGLASRLKDEGGSMLGMLRDIYRVYGYRRNQLRSLVMEGIVGLERIGRIQTCLRENPPKQVAGMKVLKFVDNQKVGGPIKSSTDLASRNVLLFVLDAGDGQTIRLVVRPSGTEPKTKVYVEVPSRQALTGNLQEKTREQLDVISEAELDKIILETNAKAQETGNSFIKYCLGPEVMGDVYNVIPEESLLVSDLVPVDGKIDLFVGIMPELERRLIAGNDEKEMQSWVKSQMSVYGEDPIGLVGEALRAWLSRGSKEGRLSAEAISQAERLLGF
jgi:phosphoglucomutase